MKPIRFYLATESDMGCIGDYIALDNPRRALCFIVERRDQCRKIAAMQMGYRARPEIAEGLRSCAYGNYVIFFLPRAADILIVRVLHDAHDIDAQLRELLTIGGKPERQHNMTHSQQTEIKFARVH